MPYLFEEKKLAYALTSFCLTNMLINTYALTEMCWISLFIVIAATIVSRIVTERQKEKKREEGEIAIISKFYHRIIIEANFRNRFKIEWTTD